MKRNLTQEVGRIINDLENDSISLSSILLRCKKIAAHLKDNELSDLITNELEGAYNDENIPTYRKRSAIPIGIFQNSFTGQHDEVQLNFDEFAKKNKFDADFFYSIDLRYSIPEMEDYMKNSETDDLIVTFTPGQLHLVQGLSTNSGNWFLKDAHYKLSKSTFPNIFSSVRNRLIEILLNISQKIEGQKSQPQSKIFSKGEYFDAVSDIVKIIESANKEIILIDNYIDSNTLRYFSGVDSKVGVKIITHQKSVNQKFELLKENFEKQYRSIIIKTSNEFHDRFLVIDNKEFYNLGASIKDAGNKTFMYTKIYDKIIHEVLVNKIEKLN